jgi:hypothetical protein
METRRFKLCLQDPAPDRILCQMNPLSTFVPYFCKIHINPPIHALLFQVTLSFRFSDKTELFLLLL